MRVFFGKLDLVRGLVRDGYLCLSFGSFGEFLGFFVWESWCILFGLGS